MMADANNGIVIISGGLPVDQTVQKLVGMLEAKGIRLFALIDHSGEAAAAGMQMPATKLLIFGNPKVGTPLMLASPSVAIDLPLKILVAEEGGVTRISYNDPEWLRARHGFSVELVANIAAVAAFAATAAALPQ
jgi:uncharacterized protein (DUF302 family)